MKESKLEQICRQVAENHGYMLIKQTGVNGVPDRILVLNGKCIWIEFKTPKGRLSFIQKHIIKKLEKLNQEVHIIRNANEFLDIIKEHDNEQRITNR